MGDYNVTAIRDRSELQHFMGYLLKDTQALDRMLKEGWFETDITRIGAEQEMCLVDHYWKPIHINLQALEVIDNPLFTSELANFNLEANLPPLPFTGTCLSDMHRAVREVLNQAQAKLDPLGAKIVLTGVLPTIRKYDVEIENITPIDRYRALMDALKDMRGDLFELRIRGTDELNVKQETAMLEACNTSFQAHLQVHPDEFVAKYNIAQAIAGPLMAITANSPLLFGKRLWHETRIALFQQSIDVRTFNDHFRERSPRVTFGDKWLRSSILDIYREDVAHFKVLLRTDIDENVFELLEQGITPRLRALNIHNSTVYRWNRPCYGISPNGKPHLRIENRILPAGPSLPDTIANAAVWLGLMNGLEDAIGDITKVLDFDEAKANFFAAARYGLDTQLCWTQHRRISPTELFQKELLPIARSGLDKAGVSTEDSQHYFQIIEQRLEKRQTGAIWMLRSFSKLAKENLTRDEISSTLTADIHKNQHEGKPVHQWELACSDKHDYEPSTLLVEEFMTTNLITVQEDDILDLVTHLMTWQKIRHVPVEDRQGKLVGLLTLRLLLRYYAEMRLENRTDDMKTVKEVMIKSPLTIKPEDRITKAIAMMQDRQISCLPVLKNDRLVGLITDADYLTISANLIKRLAKKKEKSQVADI